MLHKNSAPHLDEKQFLLNLDIPIDCVIFSFSEICPFLCFAQLHCALMFLDFCSFALSVVAFDSLLDLLQIQHPIQILRQSCVLNVFLNVVTLWIVLLAHLLWNFRWLNAEFDGSFFGHYVAMVDSGSIKAYLSTIRALVFIDVVFTGHLRCQVIV